MQLHGVCLVWIPVLAPLLALALVSTPVQRAPKPGDKLPTLRLKRVLWLPTTASYTSSDPALRPDWACQGADLGLTQKNLPYLPVGMDEVKAAVKAMDLKSATGASPEGTEETWSPEGSLKIATQFKAQYYGLLKLTKAFHQDDASGKYVEVQGFFRLFDSTGHAVTDSTPIRTRDTTKGGTSGSIGQAREAAFTIGRTLIPDWYKKHVLTGKK